MNPASRTLALAAALLAAACSHAPPATQDAAREAATAATPAPEVVEFPSGALRLKGLLWKPAGAGPFAAVVFNHGSGGRDPAHLAGLRSEEAAARLAPVFLKHGYAFLFPFRRGQGPSADQGPFMPELLRQMEEAHGAEGVARAQHTLLLHAHLDDALAALAYVKTVPGVDPRRVAVAGHSFGGLLALLCAERDPTLRAAAAFAAGAMAWGRSPALRERMLQAAREATPPLLLVYAANDYSTAPGRDLAAELERLHKPHKLLLDPPVGDSAVEGHSEVYLAIDRWEPEVFGFLDPLLQRGAP